MNVIMIYAMIGLGIILWIGFSSLTYELKKINENISRIADNFKKDREEDNIIATAVYDDCTVNFKSEVEK
jgi:hypothetical protein